MLKEGYGREAPKVAEGERVAERLRALQDRFLNELMPDDERQELADRIGRAKKRLAMAAESAAETVDAQAYALERAEP